MGAVNTVVQRLVEAHGLDCAAVVNVSSGSVTLIGPQSDDYCRIMLKQNFGDHEAIKVMAGYLSGKLHPQVALVGNSYCASGVLSDGTIVSLCGRAEHDAKSRYFYTKQLWQELLNSLMTFAGTKTGSE